MPMISGSAVLRSLRSSSARRHHPLDEPLCLNYRSRVTSCEASGKGDRMAPRRQPFSTPPWVAYALWVVALLAVVGFVVAVLI